MLRGKVNIEGDGVRRDGADRRSGRQARMRRRRIGRIWNRVVMARSISQPRAVAKRESVALRGCVNSATSPGMDWIDLAVILAALAVGGILTLPALARAPLRR